MSPSVRAKMSKRLLAERQRSPAPRPSVLLLSLSALLLASPRARGKSPRSAGGRGEGLQPFLSPSSVSRRRSSAPEPRGAGRRACPTPASPRSPLRSAFRSPGPGQGVGKGRAGNGFWFGASQHRGAALRVGLRFVPGEHGWARGCGCWATCVGRSPVLLLPFSRS